MRPLARVNTIAFLLGGVALASAAMFAAPVTTMEHEGMNEMAHSILCPFMGSVSAACVHQNLPEVPALPVVLVLVLLVGVLQFYVPRVAPAVPQQSRFYSLPPPLYQELFSNGILNSKRY